MTILPILFHLIALFAAAQSGVAFSAAQIQSRCFADYLGANKARRDCGVAAIVAAVASAAAYFTK